MAIDFPDGFLDALKQRVADCARTFNLGRREQVTLEAALFPSKTIRDRPSSESNWPKGFVDDLLETIADCASQWNVGTNPVSNVRQEQKIELERRLQLAFGSHCSVHVAWKA